MLLGHGIDRANQAWVTKAACRGCDPLLFYPERGEDTANAKRICDICVVRTPCLEYALSTPERYGIWGGASERERRRIRRRRNLIAKQHATVAS